MAGCGVAMLRGLFLEGSERCGERCLVLGGAVRCSSCDGLVAMRESDSGCCLPSPTLLPTFPFFSLYLSLPHPHFHPYHPLLARCYPTGLEQRRSFLHARMRSLACGTKCLNPRRPTVGVQSSSWLSRRYLYCELQSWWRGGGGGEEEEEEEEFIDKTEVQR